MQEQHLLRSEVISIIPVALGGLLAICGGVAAQLITHWLAIRREHASLRRERLESFAKSLFAHQQWIEEKVDSVFRDEEQREPSPLSQARMIQALHFPELKTQMAGIVDTQLPLLRFLSEQRINRMNDPKEWVKQWDQGTFSALYEPYNSKVNEAVAKCRELLTAS